MEKYSCNECIHNETNCVFNRNKFCETCVIDSRDPYGKPTNFKEKEITYRRYYTLEAVRTDEKIDIEFDTYVAAYDYMCKNYVKEINEGRKPPLYQIMEHSISFWNGTKNTMIQPVWS